MSGHMEGEFPRPMLWGAAALIGVTLLLALGVRGGLFPVIADPDGARTQAAVQAIETLDLRFEDLPDGAVRVSDLAGRTVQLIPPASEQGFVRGVLRGLARERRMEGLGQATPFRLQRWADGGLTLTDLATGRQIELGSFGSSNRAAFEGLLAETARP